MAWTNQNYSNISNNILSLLFSYILLGVLLFYISRTIVCWRMKMSLLDYYLYTNSRLVSYARLLQGWYTGWGNKVLFCWFLNVNQRRSGVWVEHRESVWKWWGESRDLTHITGLWRRTTQVVVCSTWQHTANYVTLALCARQYLGHSGLIQ